MAFPKLVFDGNSVESTPRYSYFSSATPVKSLISKIGKFVKFPFKDKHQSIKTEAFGSTINF
jgi:hypothetical protein